MMKYLFLLSFVFLPLAVFGATDTDGDGLSDEQEGIYYTDINNVDTDGDGYSDYNEVYNGYSPLEKESIKMSQRDDDKDGFSDHIEVKLGTDMRKTDTDGDGYLDYDEVMYGYSPTNTEKVVFSRKIVVDRTTQMLFIQSDAGLNIKTFPVSTGNPWTSTPSGDFDILRKIETKRYVGVGYNLPNVKWNLEFQPGFYIHGTYWHNDFGKSTHSHGCVNMRTADAEIIYKYFGVSSSVKIIGETPKKRVVGT